MPVHTWTKPENLDVCKTDSQPPLTLFYYKTFTDFPRNCLHDMPSIQED